MKVKNYLKEHFSKTVIKEIIKLFFVEALKVIVILFVLSLFGVTFIVGGLIVQLFSYIGFDEKTSIIYTVVISCFMVLMIIISLTIKDFYKKRDLKRVEEELKRAEVWDKKNKESDDNWHQRNNELESEFQRRKNELTLEWNQKNTELCYKENSLQTVEKELVQTKKDIEKIVNEEIQSYPWLAELFADYEYTHDKRLASVLRNKSHPAIRSAQQITDIAKEKHDLKVLNKLYEYQLNYYENIFPWLEEFKEIEPKTAWKIVKNTSDDSSDEYDSVRNWLSPDDWKNLPSDKKWQLALDRYIQRRKSKWEVGIDYERYVGFTYEKQGYKVKYQGALLGLEDMGRDLIAFNENETLVVQCKRWAKEKTIHEKHIFQLYGSVVLMQTEQVTSKKETQLNLFDECNSQTSNNVKGIFVTTIELSDVAKKCAEFLNIRVFENFSYDEYPRIKCNNSTLNGKIYHLPFDQQYDRVQINPNDGDCYVSTTIEAEKLGYRHAYRWQGNRESS